MLERIKPKKLVALLVAAIMTLMIAVPATAAPLPPEKGNLHIHKYIGGTTNATANGTEVDTTGWASAVAVNGVVFDLYKVDTKDGIPASGKTYVLDGMNLKVYDSGNTLIGTYPVSSAGSVKTANYGTAIAKDLPQGLYLVIENTVASTNITNALTEEQLFISAACAPFLVAVPMTDPKGDNWLSDVHVYPKNEALTIDKEPNVKGAVAVGDIVGYSIKVSIPSDIATSKKFDVIDKFDPALDLDPNSVKAVTLPTNVGLVKGATADYTVTYDSSTRKLVVSFTENGRAKIKGYTHVQVSFDTTVNALALSYVDNTISNTAKVEFRNDKDVDYDAETDDGGADIHTAAIEVSKIDETGAALNGSSFKIATSPENAAAGRFIRIDAVNSILYDYDPTSGSKWATLGAGADYKIDPNNVGKFTGLRDVVDGDYQTYYVVETKAPVGYNLLSEAIVVTFDGDEIDYTRAIIVKNSKGFTLPVTGGTGTVIFTVTGIALLGIAIVLVISRRRKSESDCTA